MKILIASDIHGSAYYCKKLISAIERENPDKNLQNNPAFASPFFLPEDRFSPEDRTPLLLFLPRAYGHELRSLLWWD